MTRQHVTGGDSPRRGHEPGNKGKTYPPDPLNKAEVKRLLDACPNGKVGTRDRALITLLVRSGLRISEALALRPHDIDYDNCTVTVMHGKGDKRRTSGIDLKALEIIQDWYACRAELDLPVTAPLFCTVSKPNPGQPIFAAQFRMSLHRYGRRAGIPKRVHPHGLRHTHACELARERRPIHVISRQLGHSNLGTTDRYLRGINPQEVIDVISSRDWEYE